MRPEPNTKKLAHAFLEMARSMVQRRRELVGLLATAGAVDYQPERTAKLSYEIERVLWGWTGVVLTPPTVGIPTLHAFALEPEVDESGITPRRSPPGLGEAWPYNRTASAISAVLSRRKRSWTPRALNQADRVCRDASCDATSLTIWIRLWIQPLLRRFSFR